MHYLNYSTIVKYYGIYYEYENIMQLACGPLSLNHQ